MILSEFWRKQAELGVIKVVDFAITTCEHIQTRLLTAIGRLPLVVAVVCITCG